MRRSSPLNTSQRTALEQYGHLILEYPVGDLRQQFEHPERPLTVEIGFGMGRSLVLMAKANPERNYVGIEVHVPGIAQCVYEAGMAYWMQMLFKCYVKCQTIALMRYSFISQIRGKRNVILNVALYRMTVCHWLNKNWKWGVHSTLLQIGNRMLNGC